ncbi:hypothetical protein [Caulobacter sp.]|uniref:hypothetical protein n=1 Tax=Caulobacter sp. TaxID=78 RepID=UPI003BA99270
MIPDAWIAQRLLVPRWRSLEQTARGGELTALRRAVSTRESQRLSPELQTRLANWRHEPGLISAAELVESALVEGKAALAVIAARRLVFQERSATPLIRRQAAKLLELTGHSGELPEVAAESHDNPVRYWRSRTRVHPRDALSWVELSFHHTIRAQAEPAQRAMQVALQLAPDNRHVLRSAARLYLHLQRPDAAHDLVVRSAATRDDPWLLAAEISLSVLAKTQPHYIKAARQMLNGAGLAPRMTTELSGALATQELIAGGAKTARKLFQQSMVDPTGNALAQAEWASPMARSNLVPPDRFRSVAETGEACAFHLYASDQLNDVSEACERWAAEEPYSIRPFEFGATVASQAENYKAAVAFASRGLKLRPRAPKLVNAFAFASASDGDLDRAAAMLANIDVSPEDPSNFVAEANHGLIAIRRGNFEEGRARYRRAILGFQHLGDRTLAASAQLYLGRELTLAGQPDAEQALSDGAKAWKMVQGGRTHRVLVAAARSLSRPQVTPAPVAEMKSWAISTRINYGVPTFPAIGAPKPGDADDVSA